MRIHMQNFKKFCWKLSKKILKTTFFCYIVARDERLKVSRRRGALPPPKKFFIVPPNDHLAGGSGCRRQEGLQHRREVGGLARLGSVCLVQLVMRPVRPRTRSATVSSAPTECDDLWAVGSFLSHILRLRTQKKVTFR